MNNKFAINCCVQILNVGEPHRHYIQLYNNIYFMSDQTVVSAKKAVCFGY